MRRQRRVKGQRLSPNERAWLEQSSALPVPSVAIELLLDPQERWPELWKTYNPDKEYISPIEYLNRIEKGN